MKKLWMIAIASVFFFASCGNKAVEPTVEEPVAEEKCCELTEEQKADFEAWNNWSSLTEDVQKELVARMKVFFDQKMAEKAEKCDAEQAEVCPEKAAKCAEFKAKWEDWDNLTLEAQKELIDAKIECCKKKCEAEKAE